MFITVEVLRHWDAIALQTEATTPVAGHSILLAWHIEPPKVDAGVPREIATAIGHVLTALGEVAFRWSGAPMWPRGEARLVPAPPRNPVRRAMDWVTTSWPTDLVTTRSTTAAVHLFEHDWGLQGQAVLVLDPDSGDAEPALTALSTRRDWRSFKLEPPVVVLMAPIVDGDGAQLSTRSPEKTEDILSRLARAFADAEIEFRAS